MNGLTNRQEKFCKLIVSGETQYAAFLKAGYSDNPVRNVVDRNASVLASATKIKQRIRELRDKADLPLISSVIERKKMLTDIQRTTVADFVDIEGNLDITDREQLRTPAVSEIKTVRRTDKLGIETVSTTLKLNDKIRAIEAQNVMEGIGKTDINQDNRTVNIIISGDEAKEKLNLLLEGKSRIQLEESRNAIEQG
jgi:phage terminase small subunit